MIRWLKSLFAWRTVVEAGAYAYMENEITGERRAVKIAAVHSPLNRQWLEGGPWEVKRVRPSAPTPIKRPC